MAILCYHAVDPFWVSPMSVTPAAFREHCEWIVRHKEVLDLPQALARLDRKGRLPAGSVALTFDDGFASLYEHAWPILREFNLPVTVFLVAQTLTDGGQKVDWVRTPPPYPLETLTRDQVREMQTSGVRFASHSYAHRDLPGLTEHECLEDLRASRLLLEEIVGASVRYLAYPRGLHDHRVRRAAARAGFTHAFSLPEGPEPTGPQAIPRVGVHHGNGLLTLRVKARPAYLAARMSPVQPLVRAGRSRLQRIRRSQVRIR